MDIPNTKKVNPDNNCDVCEKNKAPYYNLTYYIHICSVECWKEFLKRYNMEIDAIALEVKHASELGEDNNEK